jgi:prophage maintenance system killer protein
MLSKKDIISFNQRFDKGYFENESSLDFALSFFKQNISWSKKIAYLIRAILIDHVFEEGNKRTAAAVLLFYAEQNGYIIEQKKTVNIIKRIVLQNITSIKKIKRMIENGVTKKD